AVGVGTVVKAYGTWRNLYATGMAERLAGERLAARADIALRAVGVVNAVVWGVSAAMDFADAHESERQGKYQLQWLQRISGTLGLIGAGLGIWAAIYGGTTIFAGLSLTGWGLIIAVMLMALNMLVEKIKGDQISGWLERTYWGGLPAASRYTESRAEQADFEMIMATS
ncbi:hypothetical protein, partial [Burkholderia stagnalis]